jgi:arylsulfatase A-like enzyme
LNLGAGTEHPGNFYRNRPTLPVRGKSFLSALQGSSQPVHSPEENIGWELHGQRTLVRGDWKLLSTQTSGGPAWELYNIADDPGERNNLSTERLGLRDELIAAWFSYAEEVGVALD